MRYSRDGNETYAGVHHFVTRAHTRFDALPKSIIPSIF